MIVAHKPRLDLPTEETASALPPGVFVREYTATDHAGLLALYHEGMLTEAVNAADPATDETFVARTYQSRPQDRLWIAEADGITIASIGVTEDEHQIAHIRRLRVSPQFRQWENGRIVRTLVRMAAEHARSNDSLKLVIHTPVNDERAIAFLHQLGFEFARIRDREGRHLLEFYLDIYQPVTARQITAEPTTPRHL